jgi:hypothetical protein
MNELLDEVLTAHGGTERWQSVSAITAQDAWTACCLNLDPWIGSWSFGAVRGKVPSVQGESGVSSS